MRRAGLCLRETGDSYRRTQSEPLKEKRAPERLRTYAGAAKRATRTGIVDDTWQVCRALVHACYCTCDYASSTPPSARTARYVLTKSGVTWLTWLIVALLIAAFAALTGIKPEHLRPVAHTRLMGVARFVFVVVALIVAYIAFRARPIG